MQNGKDVNNTKLKKLVHGVVQSDARCIARAISLFEDGAAEGPDLLHLLRQHAQQHLPQSPIRILGVTGSPGAGKSTLVDGLAKTWSGRGERVAILAVDPSSPFSGGAVLGDRIRMSQAMADDGIFIRSLATRGSLGGLSPASFESAYVFACAGFSRLIMETVGVGQSEIDIMRIADACALVLVPGMGDVVQSLKAGIMEIAHIYVLNKADRDGVEFLEKEIRNLLALGRGEFNPNTKDPGIVRTIAPEGKGILELIDKVEEHFAWMSGQEGRKAREELLRQRAYRIAQEQVQRKLRQLLEDETFDEKTGEEENNGIFAAQEIAGRLVKKIEGMT